ncbi:MAG: HAMP domain-containing protein [Acidobacteria bacterium]|nr:HAMP domain-containing protein [Acidobacteriota bacterium]
MKTLYTRIFLWLLLVAGFTIGGVIATTMYLARRLPGPGDTITRLRNFEVMEARRIFELRGPEGLREFLSKLDDYFPGDRHLLDAWGRDLATGEDMQTVVQYARVPRTWWSRLRKTNEPIALVFETPDGKYLWLVEHLAAFDAAAITPYYLWIVAAIALFSGVLAYWIVAPLRRLHHAAERFGGGDLSHRVELRRKDEIGQLARAFNVMAGRIEQLIGAERRLLQDVSHELRSPLARLKFAVELAGSSMSGSAQQRIRKEVDRLTELVDMLLEVARAEAEVLQTAAEVVRVDELLRGLVSDCELEAAGKQCRLRWRGEDAIHMVGNRELLRRAFENVIRNGIRYAPEGSDLDIEIAHSEGTASVSVRDYGPGVPEDQLQRIFDPFFRVEDHRSRNTGGAGLGLSIVQRAVRVHGGNVQAVNANPGLRVVITLPEAKATKTLGAVVTH